MTACEMQDLGWTVTNLRLCRICDWNSQGFDSGSTFDSDFVHLERGEYTAFIIETIFHIR